MTYTQLEEKAIAELDALRRNRTVPISREEAHSFLRTHLTAAYEQGARETKQRIREQITQMDMRGNTNTEIVEAITATLSSMKEEPNDR